MVSCDTTTSSIIWWPSIKAIWVGLINFWDNPLILFVPVDILKLTLSKEMLIGIFQPFTIPDKWSHLSSF
jgi:hypothetical protein